MLLRKLWVENVLMRDRQQTFVYLVAGSLLLFALFLLFRTLLRKRLGELRRFGVDDVGRWFQRGLRAIHPIVPALVVIAAALVLIEAWGAWREVRLIRAWFVQNDVAAGPNSSFVRSGAQLLQGLPGRVFSGWRYLIPGSSAWLAGMWMLLAIARSRSRFPFFSRSSEAGSAWVALTAVGCAVWVLEIVDFLRHDPMDPGRFRAFSAQNIVAWGEGLLLGFGFLIPPLMAAVDDRTNADLASRKHAGRTVYFRLLLIQLPPWIPGLLLTALWLFLSQPAGFGPGSRVSRGDVSRWVLSVQKAIGTVHHPLEFLLGVFCTTAALWACTRSSFSEVLRNNARWWRRDGLFLLSLPIAAGLAAGLVAGVVGFLRANPRNLPSAILARVFIGEFNFGISVTAFMLLLGNWLEVRDQLETLELSEGRPAVSGGMAEVG